MCDLQMITDAKEFYVCSMAAAAKHGEFPIVEQLMAQRKHKIPVSMKDQIFEIVGREYLANPRLRNKAYSECD